MTTNVRLEGEFDTLKFRNSDDRQLYICLVKSAKIIESGVTIKAIKGNHKDNNTHKEVEALCISNTVVKFFPRGLNKVFPNLKHLQVINCGLEEISRADLFGLKGLEGLYFDDNKLKILPENLLMDMKALKEIHFNEKLLISVSPKMLEPVKDTLECAELGKKGGMNLHFDKNNTRSLSELMNRTLGLMKEREEYSQLLKAKDKQMTLKDALMEVWMKKLEAFSKTFEELRAGKLADLIMVHGQQFKAHKCILAAQSSVFEEIFTNEATADLETIKREGDFSEEVFEDFFQFFYSQDVKNEDHAMDLLQLAVEYNVTNLKDVCEDIVTKKLNGASALKIYIYGHHQSFEKLKRAAFDLIKQIHSDVGEYLYDKPEFVSGIIEAKMEYELKNPTPAKKSKLENLSF